MSTTPTKRRKMRPNNAIAMERAKLGGPQKKNDQPIDTTSAKEIKENNTTEKLKEKDHNVTKTKKKSEAKKSKEKSSSEKKRKRDTEPSPATKKSKADVPESSVIPKLSTPTPTPYTSASDSDETDDDTRARSVKRANNTPKAKAKSVLTASSAPDSDATDNANKMPVPKKKSISKTVTLLSRNIKSSSHISDSDSDETDDETQKKSTQPMSASDSDDTHKEKQPAKQDESDSDSSEDYNSSRFNLKSKNKSHLDANRISFRRKKEYNESLSAADNVKNRLSDLFVPEVNENYFISDSDSETDSGEDYDLREYPSWQRTLGGAHNKEKDSWPKQRKLGYSDKLRLEKRVKKICRREGLSFDQVREIFSGSHRGGDHLRLFQKIGKVFPNMSLHRLAKLCKEMYHEKRNMGPWTKPEVQKLEELLKIHGNNPTLISEHLNRSPKNISDYIYNHQKAPKKASKRWTKEEDEILAKEAARIIKRDGKISFHTIEPLFKGTRTQKQLHTRYQAIRNLIQPDGTLAEKRKATLYEELRYLKRLLRQVREHRLVEESQVDFATNRGFVDPKFYLKKRATIKGFETMAIKEILHKLIDKQKRIIDSRKKENLLESEPESD